MSVELTLLIPTPAFAASLIRDHEADIYVQGRMYILPREGLFKALDKLPMNEVAGELYDSLLTGHPTHENACDMVISEDSYGNKLRWTPARLVANVLRPPAPDHLDKNSVARFLLHDAQAEYLARLDNYMTDYPVVLYFH